MVSANEDAYENTKLSRLILRKRENNPHQTHGNEENGTDRQFVTALHRGLEVLRAFRPTDRNGLGNREIAERTGLPNSTISRLTYTLAKTGYLVYDDGIGRYRIGVPVLSLGYACLGGMRILDVVKVHMQEIADECGDGVMVALGSRDDLTMTYLACARAVGVISLRLTVGSRISLARSSMGRAYLAAASEDERQKLLGTIQSRVEEDDWWQLERGIKDAQEQIAHQGYYTSLGDWKSDVHSIAAPYESPNDDKPLMCFSIGGPAYVMPKKRIEEELAPKLMKLLNRVRQENF